MHIRHLGSHMAPATIDDVLVGQCFAHRGRWFLRFEHAEKMACVVERPIATGVEWRVAPLNHTADWVHAVSLETGMAQRFAPSTAVTLMPEAEVRHG